MSVFDDFREALSNDSQLVLMPISRLTIDSPIRVGEILIQPPGTVDFSALRPIPNAVLPDGSDRSTVSLLQGQNLREVCTSVTGFDIQVLREHPIAVFVTKIDWNAFLKFDHNDDLVLLAKLSEQAEASLDFIRFDFCRFDLNASLPGRVGSWRDSGACLGALIYEPRDHESYLIAGEAGHGIIVARGLGLELDTQPSAFPREQGEVGNIARYGLRLFRTVLEAASETDQFMRVMTLLEYLAHPNSFGKWQEVKKEIAAHVANNKTHYAALLERFKELTHITDSNNNERGLRTLVIHHGKYLDEILPTKHDRQELFLELQGYASKVLYDMLSNPKWTWNELHEFRKRRRLQIGVGSS